MPVLEESGRARDDAAGEEAAGAAVDLMVKCSIDNPPLMPKIHTNKLISGQIM